MQVRLSREVRPRQTHLTHAGPVGYGKTAASGLVLAKPYDAAALEGMLNEALGIPHTKSDGVG
jgi:hypothetical protein